MPSGRHFLQIPGPTNVPERILHAIAMATIDHRGPALAELGKRVLDGLRPIFETLSPVIIFPSSGGAWEAALANTLSPGDGILMYETGHFSTLWSEVASRMGLDVQLLKGDWRAGVDPARVEQRLSEDEDGDIKAVAVVHNETSTGVTSDVAAVRAAMDRVGHEALLLVDAVSSLASIEYRHDDWGVDVTVAASQKGLMLLPGLSFNAISDKALGANASARLPRAYWDWRPMLSSNDAGHFPYTPATNLLYGLAEAVDMLRDEGLSHVFARHDRFAAATHAAVECWGLEILARNSAERSSVVTAVVLPDGYDADQLRDLILDRFDLSLGAGLGKLKGRVFRIGHLGDLNDLTLAGALAGVEAGLQLAGVPIRRGGVEAAMRTILDAGP